ncbi:hypothetical protein [Vibrio mediterranei]|uniref:hypothetical protein n=1 Tax=Vibrio mediterranei TaxID=689 RepID=UPI0040684498
MNKNLVVVALSSVLGVSSAFAAGNAILNVEGEIQINGQTVIDNSGNFVGLEFAQQNQVTISDYYLSRDGVYTFVSDNGWKDVYTVSGNSESFVSYYADPQSGEYVLVAEGTWLDNGDGTYTTTLQDYPSDGVEYSSTIRETELTQPAVSYQIGSLLVKAFESEVIDSSNGEEVGNTDVYTSEYAYGGRMASFTLEDGTQISDCLVGANAEIRCKEFGTVVYGDSFVLESFQPLAGTQVATQSASTSAKRDRSATLKFFSKLKQK